MIKFAMSVAVGLILACSAVVAADKPKLGGTVEVLEVHKNLHRYDTDLLEEAQKTGKTIVTVVGPFVLDGNVPVEKYLIANSQKLEKSLGKVILVSRVDQNGNNSGYTLKYNATAADIQKAEDNLKAYEAYKIAISKPVTTTHSCPTCPTCPTCPNQPRFGLPLFGSSCPGGNCPLNR